MKYLFFTLICTTALLTIPQQLLLISPQPVTAQEPTKKLLTSAQLQDLAKSITVKILTKNGSASGTLIAKNGNNYTILTNDHVINPGESYRIQAPDGKIYPATVIKEKPPSLKNQDAALFQFQSTAEYTIATLGISAPIAVNQKIVAAGFVNDSAKLVFTQGQISLLPDKSFQGGYRIGYSNKIQPGMSGGPILNYQGEVIGINAVHAYPISDKIYTYIDNSKLSAAERQQMRQYSWGLPIYAVAKIIPEFVAKSPIKIDNSGLRAKKGLIQNIDQIAQEITVLIPNANPEDMGSGVIIAQQGNIYYVLTADHVIWNRDEKKLKDKLEIVAPDNQRYAINVSNAKRMPGVDLAVVQFTSNQKYQVATLANYSFNPENQKVFVSGFPGNKQQNKNKPNRILTAGILSNQQGVKLNTYLSFNNQSSLIPARIQTVLSDGYDLLYSNITKGGMSGGAVLDTQGRLIGIHGRVEGETSLDFDGEINLGRSSGIPISTFLNLVQQVGIDSQLKVETTVPATLKKPEEDLISKYLLPLDEVPKNSDDEISWLNYANQLWRSQKYAEARKAADKAIEKKPDFYQAWYLKGMIFSEEKKYPESIAAFDKALKINPNFAQAWKLRGNVLFLSKQYLEALASFDKAITLSPNRFDLYLFRARVLLWLQRFREAIDACNQGIKIYPDSFAYSVRGSAYFLLNDYQQAFADFDKANSLSPYRDANYYSLKAAYHYLLGDYKQAISDLTEAIRIDPDNDEYYSSRADAYSSLKKYKQAISDRTEAIRIQPHHEMYYMMRGTDYLSLSLTSKQAQSDFRISLDIKHRKPNNDSNHTKDYEIHHEGDIYVIIKDYKQAIVNYSEAIRLNPKNADYYKSRGNVHFYLKDYKQAIADYNQVIRIEPKNACYYWIRGNTHLHLKDYKRAINDYTQAIKFAPKDAHYYWIRGNTYFNLKDYKLAINDYVQAIKFDSEYLEAYTNLSIVHYEMGEVEKAIKNWRNAVKINSNFAESHLALGVALYAKGDKEAGLKSGETALKLDKRFRKIEFLKERGWGDKLIKDSQEFLNNPRIKGLI